ncbi:hypothetical protein CHS0354_037856 [Potamilus streckersoni]|uniref:Kringle domain-containing protein n=1 Tax=Potamilus streckersoni TaxID=2493646 RepID=A0AAE0W507_9BIVA|nr:hypothetical protein CHS0354_037856 [Potamilus streckersoni]
MMNRSFLAIVIVATGSIQTENGINITQHDQHLDLIQRSDDEFTAGNTKCRIDNKCGYHQGTEYSWCYTDYSDKYGYCCIDRCRKEDKPYFWCSAGKSWKHWQYCGGYEVTDVTGRPCLETHKCGAHYEDGENGFHWCFVDLNRNWGYCCSPNHFCDRHGGEYPWCYITIRDYDMNWRYCNYID